MKNALVVLFLLISGLSLTAQTLNTWKGGKPGRENDWNIAANWSLNRVPDWTQDVLIPNLSSSTRPYPVLTGMSVEINVLQVQSGASLRIKEGAVLLLPEGFFIQAGTIRGFLDTRYTYPDANASPTALVYLPKT